MTSSFDRPSRVVKELTDTIDGPIHQDIEYGKIYQLLEESGLSVTYIDQDIRLDTEPANLQFVNPNNPNYTGKVNLNEDLLIRIENTLSYLYYSTFGYVEPGEYETEFSSQKHKYLWRLMRSNQPFLRTGEIFNLYSVSRGHCMAR